VTEKGGPHRFEKGNTHWKAGLDKMRQQVPTAYPNLHARNTYEGARDRRAKMLELLGEGWRLPEIFEAIGWTRQAYYSNRKQYKDWARECDRIVKLTGDGRRPKREYINDFQSFVRWYFPDRRLHQRQQLQIVQHLDAMEPRDIKMFLIWPEAGKTATLEDYICRKLAMDPGHRFRYVSEAQDLAKRVVGTAQRRMTETEAYPKFIKDYGPFYEAGQEKNGRPWTREQFTTLQNPGSERDRNLVASSWTSAVYGSRIDTLILDDLCSQRNYGRSEEMTHFVRGTFLNRGLEMRTLIIGTRVGPGDFYERMIDAGLVTSLVILPAAGGVIGDDWARPDEPTVPEFWDNHHMIHNRGACCHGFRECPNNKSRLSALEFMQVVRHQQGEDVWHSAYQQNPGANERTTFSEYIDNCLDHERVYGRIA